VGNAKTGRALCLVGMGWDYARGRGRHKALVEDNHLDFGVGIGFVVDNRPVGGEERNRLVVVGVC
jgi:hypothetical protein